MRNINWKEVEEAKEFESLKPGGYVAIIKNAEDNPAKEYLKISYDIYEGDFKDYYENLYKAKGFWGGNFYRSYKETARGFFKGFLNAVKQSNVGFVFNNDETNLRNKLIGIVLSEEEYEANDGTVKTRLYVSTVTNVENIKKGNFAVKGKKKLAEYALNDNSDQFFLNNGFSVNDNQSNTEDDPF